METVEYVELFWDCPECGQTHISAIFNPQGNRCPNCLYWRVEDVELYEAPDSQIVTDPKLIDRKPFWVCKVCDAVNEDTGIAPDLLQCSNCDSYQVSEVGGITGDIVEDRQAPNTVAVGETVELRTNSQEDRSNNSVDSRVPNLKKRSRWLTAGIASITLVGGGLLGNSIWSSKINAPATLQVQVTDLQWTVEIDVEEKQTFTRQSWRDSVPAGATIVRSQTRQRGTRQEQKGLRAIMVEEQFPPQRISATRTICRLNGTYTIQTSWFEKPQSKSGTWELPCQEYDRVEIGERVKLLQNTANSANLM